MDKEYFLELLNKYLRQEASKEECDLLFSHYNLFDLEPGILNSMSKEQKSELKNEIDNNIRNIISSSTERDKGYLLGNSKFWISIISSAAVLLMLFGWNMYFTDTIHTKKNSLISQFSDIKENRLIQLPDGTSVIVSPGSKLNYPSSFDGLPNREVYLDGQAYFDVKHNSLKPFIIHTGKLKTTVLGTAFEINAWSSQPDVRVTVSRGKVKVEDQNNRTISVIMPNHQITYDKGNKNIIQKEVNASEYIEWKDQDLLLSNVTISEAMELLEKRFQVKITISDENIRSKRFTTTVLKGERLDQILKSVAEFNEAKFTYDEEKAVAIISSK